MSSRRDEIKSIIKNHIEKYEKELDSLDIDYSVSPKDVSLIIREQLKRYESKFNIDDIGTVIQVGDGIARIHGLERCMSSELLEFPNGVYGLVLNLEEDSIGCVLLGKYDDIKEGDIVKRTGKIIEVPVGDELIGRVINPLGEPIDGKGVINSTKFRAIEAEASGVIMREGVTVPLQTGIKAIDSIIPIGRGQRELIIGDRQTGKTAIAIDTIINQKGKDVICIYVAIGQKRSSVAQIIDVLEKNDAMEYSIVVSSSASELASLQYIAPYSGVAIAEEFMYSGKDVLIIYDDLSKHAVAYRTMSLLLRRPPGREAYPGDVFYLHARLLERAARLHKDYGGGSITALPIVETLAGDISAYIPTNIISITDGQIFLEQELFSSGQRPAVNSGFSVSRVGGAAQTKAMKKVSAGLKLELAQYRELLAFAQFGSELDKETRKSLEYGKRIMEILKQEQYNTMSVEDQVIILYVASNNYLSDIKVEKIKGFEKMFLEYIGESYSDIKSEILKTGDLSKYTEEKLIEAINQFKSNFK